MVWEDWCRVTSHREDFGFSEQDGGDMEPCPCNRQEQEVLPVLSQLCALALERRWRQNNKNPSLNGSTNPLG